MEYKTNLNKYFILIAPFAIVLIHKLLVYLNVKTICIWYLLTGHKCIGCGMTTAMVYLLEGKIHLAYESNHLVFIVAPILLFCWLKYLYNSFIKTREN